MSRDVGLRVYLPLALAGFIAATTGSDLLARTSIAGETLGSAFSEHVHWVSITLVGALLLLIPFLCTAFICAGVGKRARTRSVAAIFGVAMIALLYFYFEGFRAAQLALLDEKWTAAALSVGLLPFFIGIPVLATVAVAGALATRFERRASNKRQGN